MGRCTWLVTDALSRLGVVATYGINRGSPSRAIVLRGSAASTSPPRLCRRTSFPIHHRRPAAHRHKCVRCTSARAFAPRPAVVWSDPPLPTSNAGPARSTVGIYGSTEAPAAFERLPLILCECA